MRRWTEYFKDPREKVDVVYYAAPASVIKDRLELKGYTLNTAKRAFEKWMRAEAEDSPNEIIQGMEKYYDRKAKILKSLDANRWLDILRRIKESNVGVPRWDTSAYREEQTAEDYMLQNEWYGFSGVDLYVPLRLALEICAENDNFIYDLTDLVSSGYADKREDFVATASEFDASEYASSSKIIILTEGRSDGWILSESLSLLYPHLSDYFAFMDFETAKVEGGASNLAKIVRSFAGAGIANKVIAIFDNDAAGEQTIRALHKVKLPGNFRILKLPQLKMLQRYPTIGPSGKRLMNVNGSAASIELYLGEDVLREGDKLLPVHWSAYNPNIGKYQGEVLGKERIHKRFKEKLARQKSGADLAVDQNWSGIRSIMSSIFAAFHRYDQKLILAQELEKYYR